MRGDWDRCEVVGTGVGGVLPVSGAASRVWVAVGVPITRALSAPPPTRNTILLPSVRAGGLA